MRITTLLLALLFAVGGPVREGLCSFINMDTRSTVTAQGGEAVVAVAGVNRGDEKAVNVRVEALFPGEPQSSPVFNELQPGAGLEHRFVWRPDAETRYRQAVIPLVTHYSDANLYEFSSISYALFAPETPAVATVSGRIETIGFIREGMLKVQFRSLDGVAHDIAVRLVVPKEIAAEPRLVKVTVPVSGQAEAEFSLENFAALPGSVYVVWAVFSEETAEGVVETPVIGNVRIESAQKSLVGRHKWTFLTILCCAAAMYVVWQFRGKK